MTLPQSFVGTERIGISGNINLSSFVWKGRCSLPQGLPLSKILLKYLSWGISLAFLVGCSTLNDAKNAEGSGKKQSYTNPIDDVWRVAELSLLDLGLDVVEKNRRAGYILAKRNMTTNTYGENVAIFVRSSGPGNTVVEVISKKVLATTIFAPDWTDQIFSRLDVRLKK